ncbi:hypothetical protein G7059_01750 [Erysipelothrix sp. HDW6A]|uniref:hypothetical protein n=1 Tax=Erysipelothrix sp. HDW6A TaxID=2714928 RepID=UPI0014076587|nr:hypothetical protein [Erysipelothrix sp. HDW6A]QIK56658.1 hypothetical protein G7059_01750 [Erysipelothrix sp. HDW6A]
MVKSIKVRMKKCAEFINLLSHSRTRKKPGGVINNKTNRQAIVVPLYKDINNDDEIMVALNTGKPIGIVKGYIKQ